MKVPSNDFTHLWNDMPYEERDRLMPYAIENELLHMWKSKQMAIEYHKKHMKEIDAHMANLEQELDKYRK